MPIFTQGAQATGRSCPWAGLGQEGAESKKYLLTWARGRWALWDVRTPSHSPCTTFWLLALHGPWVLALNLPPLSHILPIIPIPPAQT